LVSRTEKSREVFFQVPRFLTQTMFEGIVKDVSPPQQQDRLANLPIFLEEQKSIYLRGSFQGENIRSTSAYNPVA
jgi:hypothetical protein